MAEMSRAGRVEDAPADCADVGRRAVVVCDPWLGSNGYAGAKALRRLGWDVHTVAEREYVPVNWTGPVMKLAGRALRDRAVAEFNRALMAQTERISPEFLLVFKGTFVQESALRTIAARGIRSYCFFPDISVHAHGKYIPRAIPAYDWIFSTKSFGPADLNRQFGIRNVSTLKHAFDPDLHRPVPLAAADQRRYGCDVSFIGTWSPKKERILGEFANRRPDCHLRIFGDQWHRMSPDPVLQRAVAGFGVTGGEYVSAIRASTINLGLLREVQTGGSTGDLLTSRTFHIPAAGGFMLHERTTEVTELFGPELNAAHFSDVDELVEKVDLFLSNAALRDDLAERATAVVWSGHSWDHRILEILRKHEELS